MNTSPYVKVDASGRQSVELPRGFKVRRPAPGISLQGTPITLVEEVVWAHSYSPDESGALVFSLLKMRDVPLPVAGEEGKGPGAQFKMVPVAVQTYVKVMAPGTWYDVEEIIIPELPPAGLAN